MSPERSEQLSVESLAVAFVVESSLAVAQAWRQVLIEYVQLLLKRLTDTHPNFKVSFLYITFTCPPVTLLKASHRLRFLWYCGYPSIAAYLQEILRRLSYHSQGVEGCPNELWIGSGKLGRN